MKMPMLGLGKNNYLIMIRICKSLYDIFLSSEGSLLSSIGILLGNLQKDTQYRIREKILETLGKLGVHFVNKNLNK